MNEATPERLTAAECAARTGLTVRALRVYETYGLIAPVRSATGWRHYGAQELLKLNEIGLLKVLGLTLNQIRDLTRRPSPPSLRQLLELPLATWKQRRAEAERGQAVAEAALQQLQTDRSLSVEKLCSLIRSFEMTPPPLMPRFQPPMNKSHRKPQRWIAMPVTTCATKLVLEPIGQPTLELEQTGETDFALPKFDLVLCFELRPDEPGVCTDRTWADALLADCWPVLRCNRINRVFVRQQSGMGHLQSSA